MPNFAFGETVIEPPVKPPPPLQVGEDEDEFAAAALAPEVRAPMTVAPVDWVPAVAVPGDARPAGTVVTVEPSSTST